MKKTTQISAEIIIETVMQHLAGAKTEVMATMDVEDELANPLPQKYFQLFKKKINEGVRVKRLAFGSEKSLKDFKEKESFAHTNYKIQHAKSKNYKRMILIDGEVLFFRDSGGFYISKDPKLIEKYNKYFAKVDRAVIV